MDEVSLLSLNAILEPLPLGVVGAPMTKTPLRYPKAPPVLPPRQYELSRQLAEASRQLRREVAADN